MDEDGVMNIKSQKCKYFIAYATADGRDFAEHVRKEFANSFMAQPDLPLGKEWKKGIDKKIDECKYFIPIFTLAATKSYEVIRELRRARRKNKDIVPCLHKVLYNRNIPESIRFVKGWQGHFYFETKEELVRELKPKIEASGDTSPRKDAKQYKPSENSAAKANKLFGLKIKKCANKRLDFSQYYDNLVEEAKPGSEIDVIGVSLRGFFAYAPGASFKEYLIKKELNCRLLLLNPKSKKMVQLIQEFSKNFSYQDLAGDISKIIKEYISPLYKTISEHPDFRGSLEIRVFDAYLPFSLFRVNDNIIFSIYYYHKAGTHSPVFWVDPKSQSSIKDLKTHFNTIWDRTKKVLIKVDQKARKPFINNIEKYIIKKVLNKIC